MQDSGTHRGRTRFAFVLAAVLTVSLSACGSSGSGSGGSGGSGSGGGSGDTIKIGAVAAESGAYGVYGNGIVKGMQAEINLINAAGGILGHKVVLEHIDDQSDPSKAAIGVQQMLSEGNPPLLIHCGAISADCAPILPFTGRAKVLTTTAAATPDFGDPSKNPYNFVVFPGSNVQVAAHIAALKQIGNADKVGIISGTDTGNKALLTADEAAFPAGGIKIVKSVTIDPTAVDFTAQLQQLRSAGVKTLAAEVQATNYVTLMKNIQSIGWTDVTVLAGTTAAADTVMAAIPAGVANQFIVVAPHTVGRTAASQTSENPQEQGLVAEMKKIGAPLDALNGESMGADEVSLVKWAAEAANSIKPADIYAKWNSLSLSTQLPAGTLMALPHPDWSASNHSLQGADLGSYWWLLKPGQSLNGTWLGEPLKLS